MLRCPHCGDALTLGDAAGAAPGAVERGVLYDHCAAYQVVAGISYVRADEAGRRALEALGNGDDVGALVGLLAAELPDPEPVSELLAGDSTFREALSVLVRGPEADYLLYRFSDPVYRACAHLFGAVAAADRPRGPVLDFGGGAGHLTRGLSALVDDEVVLADVSFRKLWLATRFVVPTVTAVCCDGNQMLPFASETFAMVASADAFHYVWARQLLATELRRVSTDDGVLVMAHLHNRLVDNWSAGMPLPPDGYRRLLGPDVRLLAEDMLFEAALVDGPVDVRDMGDDELAGAAALAAVVAGCPLPDELRPAPPTGGSRLSVNPLYRPSPEGEWTLVPPTPQYADEYPDMYRYLPREVLLLDAADVEQLRRSCVLIDLPDRYL
jgi:SAM-dependent methyltransferase